MRYIVENKITTAQAESEARIRTRKPPAKNEKIPRVCLAHGCKTHFEAENRFIRLCSYHRSNWDE